MKKIAAIQHVKFEDLGGFLSVLEQRDCSIQYFQAGVDNLDSAQLERYDLVIILGGPISVNDSSDFPFIDSEIELISARLQKDLPTLGICLGAQLMARALGANVYPGPVKEIGWAPLEVASSAMNGYLGHLDSRYTQMLHWHGETFDLPAGCELLASTQAVTNQAFSYGKKCLGLQFHPEVLLTGLEKWFIGHAQEISRTAQINVDGLRSDTEKYGPTLEKQGRLFFEEWLRNVFDS